MTLHLCNFGYTVLLCIWPQLSSGHRVISPLPLVSTSTVSLTLVLLQFDNIKYKIVRASSYDSISS